MIVVLGLAPLFVAPMGCKRKQPVKVEVVEEEAPQLATVIHVADPKATVQLVKGFYELEQNSWRWTAGKFAVALRPPRGASERGAVLQLKLAVADAVLERVKSMTVKARAGKVELAPGDLPDSNGLVLAACDDPPAIRSHREVVDGRGMRAGFDAQKYVGC